MRVAMSERPIGEQRRLARSRFAQHDQWGPASSSLRIEGLEGGGPSDVDACPRCRVRLVRRRLLIERFGLRSLRIQRVDDGREVREYELAERRGIRVVLANRQPAR